MPSTLDLLQLPPEQALVSIVQASLKPGFDVAYLKIGPPVNLGGGRTQVQLEVDKGNAPVEYWRYPGQQPFIYQRLDLSAVLGPLAMEIRVDLPATYDDVMAAVTRQYKIPFAQNDYQPGTVTYSASPSATIVAQPESLRWIGQMAISVKPKVRDLSDVLTETDLTQLQYDTETLTYTGSAVERLVNNLNTLNADRLYEPLLVNEIAYSDPEVLSPNDDDYNTQIVLGVGSTHPLYRGNVTCRYRRLYLPRLSNYDPVDIYSTQVQNTLTLAALVANKLGMVLDLNDVVEDALPYIELGEMRTITIYFKPTSLMYYGELTVDWTKGAE